MKFTCTKENLEQALGLVASLAGRHTNLPILANVLIQASEAKIECIATNLETGLRVTVRAKVDRPGAFTVPAKTFVDYIHLLPDEQVVVDLEGSEIKITGGDSETKIKGAPADEFPILPEIEEEHAYTLSSKILASALEKTVIAAAKNEIRPELSGVYFGFFTERYPGLLLAATDSYRLAEARVPVEQGSDMVSCIVPSRTVFEMIRLFSLVKSGEPVRLWVSAHQIAIRYESFELTSRLVDGKYPDYAQIIPTAVKTSAVFPVDIMRNKIKAASIFTTTGVNAVAFDVKAGEKTVAVSSMSSQTGEHASEIDAEVTGEENSILLNHRYVLDGLSHMAGDAELQINSGEAPCLFRERGSVEYVYIVMPIRQ